MMDEDKYKEMVAFLQKSDQMLHLLQAETGIYFSSSDESDQDIYIQDIVKFKLESPPQPQESLYKLSDSDSEEENDSDDILSFTPFKKANN